MSYLFSKLHEVDVNKISIEKIEKIIKTNNPMTFYKIKYDYGYFGVDDLVIVSDFMRINNVNRVRDTQKSVYFNIDMSTTKIMDIINNIITKLKVLTNKQIKNALDDNSMKIFLSTKKKNTFVESIKTPITYHRTKNNGGGFVIIQNKSPKETLEKSLYGITKQNNNTYDGKFVLYFSISEMGDMLSFIIKCKECEIKYFKLNVKSVINNKITDIPYSAISSVKELEI